MIQIRNQTLKGFALRGTLSGFVRHPDINPGLSLRSNPGLELANAFGVLMLPEYTLDLV